ncbi:MAG: winged helix-turn-helix domain-containing protein [Elusimicrobiota bacterium]|jgi:DNA-binding response OmpR family regulator
MSQLVFWVVQPDPAVAKRWEYLFTREGWGVEVEKAFAPFAAKAASARLGLALIAHAALESGSDSIRQLKRQASGLSVILTSHAALDPEKVIDFLEAGADDHFLDTLDDRLLLAKLKAHLRRALPSMASALDVLRSPDGGIKLDRSQQQVWAKDARAKWAALKDLTPTEFKILALFLEQPGRVYDRRDIVESIWQGEGGDIRPGTVDKHIESLRRKLGRLGSRVRTVYGVGYGYRED